MLMTPFSSPSSIKSRLARKLPSTSQTTGLQAGSSKEFISQPEVKSASKLVAEKASSEECINDKEGCLVFQDDSNSNDHEGDGENQHRSDGDENDNISVNVEQLMKPSDLIAPATPNSRHHSGNNAAGPPSNLFLPPREVTIDPYAVPPSPMKEPSMAFLAQQEDQGTLLTLGNVQQPRSQQQYQLQSHGVLGDPVGDIAMKRQLLDAQRLVRVILGKPLSSGGEHQPLETSNILQAIRSFALMKQELVDLRKRQEEAEGDPPCILQTLGSPATSATTSNGTKTPRTAASAIPSPSAGGYFFGRNKQQDDSNHSAPLSASCAVAALSEAKSQLESLEEQLSAANETILRLQTEKILGRSRLDDSANKGLAVPDTASSISQLPADEFDLKATYKRLLQDHKISVEESKRNLDMVLEEVASIPKRVLAKDSVREKLKMYVQTIAQQTSKLEQIELLAEMQKSKEESQVRIRALEERLHRQEATHEQHAARLNGTSESVTPMEGFVRSSPPGCKDGGENNSSVFSRMRDLQTRLFESQAEAELLTKQIRDLQVGLDLGNYNIGEVKSADGVEKEHLIFKELSQNQKSRIQNSTERKREMEEEKKID